MKKEKFSEYHRGTWSEIELETAYEVSGSAWKWDEWLESFGFYNSGDTIGNRDGFSLAFYPARNDNDERTLVHFSDGSRGRSIILVDQLDELLFLKEFAAPCALSQIEFLFEELNGLIGQAYQAWHGHSRFAVCSKCDPHEHERRMEAARERRAGKRETPR